MLRLSVLLLATALTAGVAAAGPKPPAGHCPPGLAKKGCVPPGQAKKRYVIGEPLPADVTYRPVPGKIVVVLEPPGKGQKWVEVDDDLVLIAEATRQVIKAIDAVERAAKGW